MSYTRDWDETKPIDHTKFIDIPGKVREVKTDVAERLKEIIYGFTTGETDQYKFKKLPLKELPSDPTNVADLGFLYTKDVSGKTELFYEDADGNIKQLTNNGKLNIEATEAVLLTTDQTIAGVKTFSSFPITPSSAPSSDYEVANKKYVDDNKPTIQSAIGSSDTSTTSTSFVDMADMSLSVSVASGEKLKIDFTGCFNAGAGGNALRYVRLVRNDGSSDTVLAGVKIYMQDWGYPVAISVCDAPSAGTYTYKIQWQTDSGTFYNRPATYPSAEHRSLTIIKIK